MIKKKEVVWQVAQLANLKLGDTTRALKALVAVIQDNLISRRSVSFSGLGSFHNKPRKIKSGVVVRTGAFAPGKATRKIQFRPTTTLRKIIQVSL